MGNNKDIWICIECKEDIGEGCRYIGPGTPKDGIICPGSKDCDETYYCKWILVTGTVDRHGSRYV